ncbi:MAG TPA: peptidoglycan editing factor PgeF [Xanthobacteraceae bacterium]|nr:peptidoglycan editing factor PgeF [Xanthobacteraceae bacterium]
MTQPLRAHTLAQLTGIRHAFFTRAGGVSGGVYASLNAGVGSNDAPHNVAENRARMAGAMGVPPERLLTCYQIHSPEAVVAVAPWRAETRPRADAIVTAVTGLAIGISTADCGPVLFADAQARVIGAAHAGWRGALAGVTDATIAAMERLGAAPERIVAALGPMIRQPNYETGTDVRDRFVAADPANARFFRPAARAGHFMFDLAGYVVARLAAAGIGTIEDVEACTYAEAERFFSYRRMTHRGEADYGRHINAIVLEESGSPTLV